VGLPVVLLCVAVVIRGRHDDYRHSTHVRRGVKIQGIRRPIHSALLRLHGHPQEEYYHETRGGHDLTQTSHPLPRFGSNARITVGQGE